MTDRERRLGLWSTTLGVLSCFMSTSTFPWNDLLHVPVLGSMLLKIQFPWRCMALAIPALLLATCCTLSYLQRRAAAKNMGAMLLAVTLAGVMLFYSGYLPTISEKYLGDASQTIIQMLVGTTMACICPAKLSRHGMALTRENR